MDNKNPEASKPAPGLKALNKLVGKWKISGMAGGETTFEWMEGGCFLIQRGTFEREGRTHSVLERPTMKL